MPPFTEIKRQLLEQAYATVPFSIRRPVFQKVIDVFFDFLKLPLSLKETMYFQIRPEDRGSEVGYKRYLREEGKTDNREYVHYHPFAEERFAKFRNEIPEFSALLDVMKPIHDKEHVP